MEPERRNGAGIPVLSGTWLDGRQDERQDTGVGPANGRGKGGVAMSPSTDTLLARLSSRDLAILDDLEQLRLLSTRQIQRLHFPVAEGAHRTSGGATKASWRVLTRLEHDGLIAHLQGRIGGTRQGSQGFVWQLAATGERLQRQRRGSDGPRRRYVSPSQSYLEHRTVVNDLVVRLRELHRAREIELLAVEPEPDCWRPFTGPHGAPQTLKPDLYTVIARGEFENHWFIEVDLATEHLPQVVAKAQMYRAHAATGVEQRRLGIYPAVLWLTTNRARAAAMTAALRTDPGLPPRMFTVIPIDQSDAFLLGAGGQP